MQDRFPDRASLVAVGFPRNSLLFVVAVLIGVPLAVWFRFTVTTDPITGTLRYQPLGVWDTLMKTGTLLGALSAVGVLFWIVERLWPEDAEQRISGDDKRLNGLYILLNQCLMVRVAATVLAAAATTITLLHIPRLPPTWIAAQPDWLRVIEIAVLKDFLGYWNHRLFHTMPALWRFHAVHHSSEQVYWFSAAREHPFEQIVSKMATVLPLYLLGFPLTVLGPFVGLWLIYLMFLHANTRISFGPVLRYLVVSPAYHRWHHSSDSRIIDKNFATLLPVWDFLFGTAHFPKEGHADAYGLCGERMPSEFWAQFRYPFRRGHVQAQKRH